MPSLQLTQEEIQAFEHFFQLAVEQRTNQMLSSVREAYFLYLGLNEHKRQHFWDYISQNTKLSRERVYKYFRFTWSRQFYDSVQEHRENIRNIVIDVIQGTGLQEKTPEINSIVWSKVWQVYKYQNLHYDGTDQFVRNCVNLYFNKLKAGNPLQFTTQPIYDLPKKVNVDLRWANQTNEHQKTISQTCVKSNQSTESEFQKRVASTKKEDNYKVIGDENVEQWVDQIDKSYSYDNQLVPIQTSEFDSFDDSCESNPQKEIVQRHYTQLEQSFVGFLIGEQWISLAVDQYINDNIDSDFQFGEF